MLGQTVVEMLMKRKAYLTIIFLLAAFVSYLLIVTLIYNSGGGPHRQNQKDSEYIVNEIKSYKNRNGHYPESLDVLGLKKMVSDGCRWEYRVINGNAFELQLGNYDSGCEFILFYSSQKDESFDG